MTNYAAQIVANVVIAVIAGDYEWANANLDGTWVDCTCGENPCASPNYTYDPMTQDFSAPIYPPEPVEPL